MKTGKRRNRTTDGLVLKIPREDPDDGLMITVRVVAVVVNWNTRDLLSGCLATLEGEGEWLKVVCVDNGSSDGSAEMVARDFPRVELIRNQENAGFAAATNQGIEWGLGAHDPAFFALVNSDAVVPPSALAALVSELERRPGAAAAGPALRHPDGRLQTGAAGFLPTAWAGVSHFFFLSALTRGRCRGVFVNQEHFVGRRDPVAVDWVTGACAVVRSEVIRKVGMLDTDFFMYGEDVEWCCRMRGDGWTVWYVPRVTVVHHQGATSGTANPMWLASLCALVRRDRGAAEHAVFRSVAALGLAARWLLYSLAALVARDSSFTVRARNMAAYASWAFGFGISRR